MKRGFLVGTVAGMLVLALVATAWGAGPAPMDILTKALSLHKGVKDYTANVTVDTDIPELDIPRRTAKVYVKPPDKTYVESSGVVVIPKRALLFGDLAKDIRKEANVVLAGSKVEGGRTVYCVKVLPKEDTHAPKGQEPRVMVWVDGRNWTVQKVHVLSGATVVASVDFTYQQVQGFWMPTKVACTIPKETMRSTKSGHVSVSFANYRINTGLTDEFFARKNRQSRRGAHSPGSHR